MARKTAIDKMNTAIAAILNEYAGEIAGNMDEIAKETGKRGAQALRQKSRETFPVDGKRKVSGEYAKGWTYRVEQTRMKVSVTIFNDHPALPHLLEYGHVTRNGTGRTFPRTPAHEHIAPVAEEIAETFEKEVLAKL